MVRKLLILLITSIAAAQSQGGQPSLIRLAAADQAVFCGVDGHEPGPKYGQLVNAEVTWRIAAGARTPAEALGQMRTEYCLAKAAGESK